ncbi:hypothetical protein SAMN05660964_01833 [Thiothrix caldifontis]|uniref:Uncharacterized protein n=1 Tax=Thiothrix caldifontis TaxID=525918 RepID=A0A1H4C226_9GAMM|nr:HEPN domain-containing protein [Thiothrix caldifontis]SEA54438.1 hypothetical protein SAMN05660964_01833 [Thiothrix caldifontis]
MEIKYLIAFYVDDGFCGSKDGFLSFLRAYNNIKISDTEIDLIEKNKSHVVSYKVFDGDVSSVYNSDKYRYIIFSILSEDAESLRVASRFIRKASLRVSNKNVYINTLWDDVGRGYAIELFPLINKVENLMRYLITQFMVVNVGVNWSVKEVDANVVKKVKESKSSSLHEDDLYKVDFRQLSDVLFKEISVIDYNSLIKAIKNKENFSNEDVATIKGYIPVSNWDKYFRNIFDMSKEDMRSKWEDLSDYRNDIAHNRNISFPDYGVIKNSAENMILVIEEAIKRLDRVDVNDEDKESVISSYENITGVLVGENTDSIEHCWIVNTNVTWDDEAYTEMLNGNKAAAYYGRKWSVTGIKKGDIVFLYHNQVGIVAKGVALSEYQSIDRNDDPNEEFFIPLEMSWKVDPVTQREYAIPAWKINQTLNTGYKFRQTTFSIPPNVCRLICKLIEEKEEIN